MWLFSFLFRKKNLTRIFSTENNSEQLSLTSDAFIFLRGLLSFFLKKAWKWFDFKNTVTSFLPIPNLIAMSTDWTRAASDLLVENVVMMSTNKAPDENMKPTSIIIDNSAVPNTNQLCTLILVLFIEQMVTYRYRNKRSYCKGGIHVEWSL